MHALFGTAMTSTYGQSAQVGSGPLEVACGDDVALGDFSDNEIFGDGRNDT
jgi:hypothetical protein